MNTSLGGFSIDVLWEDAAGHVVVTPEGGGESSEECSFSAQAFSFVSGRNVNRVCVSKPSGCTAGRHFVFVVPSTLVESTVSPPLSLKASNVSCTPQRLMRTDSTLSDVYTVPLHGCGVQKYVRHLPS